MFKKRVGWLIGATALFSVFCNLLMLTGPLFMLQVYDRVLASRSEETLVALFTLIAGLFALYGVFEYSRGRVMARVGARIQSLLGSEVFLETLERSALKKQNAPGSIADLDGLRVFAGSPVLLALFDIPWTPIFITAIFIFHPALGWLAVIGGGILVVVALLNQFLTGKKSAMGAAQSNAMQSFSQTANDRSDVIWAQGMHDAIVARYERMQEAAIDMSLQANDWIGSFSAFTRAFRLFLQSAILAVGAWLVLQQQLTPGAMIASSILLGRALAPVDVVIGQWSSVQRARRAWKDVLTLLSKRPPEPTPTELPVPEARLTVQNVSVLTRAGDPPILNRISFSVAPGEALGVIGRSGAGKSTLARLVTGLVTPAAGEVRLGGATLGQYGAKTLGRHIGYLPQDVRLFPATVAENIAQMESEPDSQRVFAAAKKAHVHETILSLPDGYDTIIDESSVQLSGGQKQRLALARALYGDPVVLILDEPNSALDADGSEALNNVVVAMKHEGKSVLIMTHRPTAIQSCDKLLVLEKGNVTAFGPRDEVIKATMKNASQVSGAITRRAPA